MTKIPASLIIFQRRFPDDDACARRLIAVRWPPIATASPPCSCRSGSGSETAATPGCSPPSFAVPWSPPSATRCPVWSRPTRPACRSAAPRDRHQPHVVGGRPAHEILVWIHTALCNLKGWARGGCHGLRAKCLQTCLGELVFRFNRRQTSPLPHLDQTGTKCISSSDEMRPLS